MNEKRKECRTPILFDVKVVHPSLGTGMAKMKDMSADGIFLSLDDMPSPAIGDIVQIQVQGMLKEAPLIEMEIMRVISDGIGLRRVPTEEDEH